MAHYAELDENNVVLRVVVINDSDTLDANGIESEEAGIAFCKNLFGQNTNWKKASYNTYAGEHSSGGTPFRKNYPGAGYVYDPQKDAFYVPESMIAEADKAYLVFDEDKCIWVDTRPQPEIGVTRV